MNDFEKLKVGGEVFKWVWSNSEEIGKRLARIKDWFTRPGSKKNPSGILIIGPGGVGKTTLAKILSGGFDRTMLEDVSDYREDRNVVEFKLKDDPRVSIVVPPGQEHRRPSTWKEVYSKIAGGGYRGVILVNSYGYHTFGPEFRRLPLFQEMPKPQTKKRFLSAWTEDRRNAELNVTRNIAPHVQQCRRKLWFLTVVTKQDLWWGHRDLVSEYYAHGPYHREIIAMFDHHDSLVRRHEIVLASLLINNFQDGKGEILQPNTAGYDYRVQVNSLRHLIETTFDLMTWEDQ